MAIAERFSGFSRDFNTPIKDFTTSREAGIFNVPTEGLSELLGGAADIASQLRNNSIDLATQAKTSIASAVDSISSGVSSFTDNLAWEIPSAKTATAALGLENFTDAIGSISRMAKSEFNNIVNLAGASEGMIKGIVDDVFGNFPPDVKNAINSVGNACRRQALQNGLGIGNNFRRGNNCNSLSVGGTACPPGATTGLLGTLGTDVASALNRGMTALKKAVQGIASLLSMGYSANLCNVLTSVLNLTGVEDKSVISYAAAAVLNKEGLKGSLNAALDMAKSNVGNLGALAPLAIANTAKNLSSSLGITSANIKQTSESALLAFDTVDPKWRLTDDNTPSTSKLGLKNPTTAKLVDYGLRTTKFDTDNLDAVYASNDRTFAASYALL